MSSQDKNKLSAQVILKPAEGQSSIPPENITSENVHQVMPSAEDFNNAQKMFTESGFRGWRRFWQQFFDHRRQKTFRENF